VHHRCKHVGADSNLSHPQKWLTFRSAPTELDAFERGPWGQKFPTVAAAWRRVWDLSTPDYVLLCRQLKLFSEAAVAVDSSKFKAVNSRDNNFTPGKVDRRQEQIEQSIHRYLQDLDSADRTLSFVELAPRSAHLKEKLKTLREQMRRMDAIREQLKAEPDGQLSTTDPDARSMISQAKGTGLVGYNVQTAVDAKHHLIVAHEVTNVGSDRAQLSKLAMAAREAMGKKRLRAYADRGYFNAPQIKACDEIGVEAFVPKPMTSTAKANGRFDRRDFIYIARDDEYQCPAGQRAIYRFTREENGLQLRRYWSSACPQCPMKQRCTPSDYRAHRSLGA
jgi:hypothetical protein